MPIRPEYRKYYGPQWRKFRLAVLEAAGNKCQRCGNAHRLLNLAHLSHDPADRVSLAVLCPSCHSKNDTPQRLAMTRRTRATRRGQLWISDELRFAPLPVRLWPLAVRQMDLFSHQD
jgi:5-methylcytosine-specific restriction endonuclease McrA